MVYKSLVKKVSIPTEKKTKQKEYLKSGQLPIVDQGKELVGGYTENVTKALSCTLPVIIFGDHTKAVKYINFPFGAGADGIKVLEPKEGILPKYLYYGTHYLTFKIVDKGYARHYQHIEKKDLPVPPLEDQHRIVTRIEELFSQLDSGVETLKKTKEQLKVYRQAVLKEAFAHIDEYNIIRNMSSLVTSGSRGWAKYYSNSGAKFVRIGNLTRTGIDIDFKDTQFVELPDKAEGVRSKLLPNDVLVSITADLGSIALVPDNIDEAYINQHIALVRFNNPNQGKFMAYYLRSDYGQKELLKNKRGAGKLGLGLDDIRDSRVPIVTDDMASSVVAEIESRLSVCDSIEKTIDTALQEAEALRQSILKQAFEGGL